MFCIFVKILVPKLSFLALLGRLKQGVTDSYSTVLQENVVQKVRNVFQLFTINLQQTRQQQ